MGLLDDHVVDLVGDEWFCELEEELLDDSGHDVGVFDSLDELDLLAREGSFEDLLLVAGCLFAEEAFVEVVFGVLLEVVVEDVKDEGEPYELEGNGYLWR